MWFMQDPTAQLHLLVLVIIIIFGDPIIAGAIPRKLNQSPPEYSMNTTENHDAVVIDYSCYDSNAVPYLGTIPDSMDCHRYLLCKEIIDGIPTGVPQSCFTSEMYDIGTCKCRRQEDALCFDSTNPEHGNARFKCASPITSLSRNKVEYLS